MVRWLARCFRGPKGPASVVPGEPESASAESQAEQGPAAPRNALSSADGTRQDALLAFTLDMDRFGETERAEAVTSLEDARQLILKLKARVQELEGSAGQNADTLLTLRHIRMEQEARAEPLPGSNKRGNEGIPLIAESLRDIPVEAGEEPKSVPHLFQAYTKQELVETLSRTGKPAAAVLLQAVYEEDLVNVPPALLLDVDPAVGDAVAAAPELVARLKHRGTNPVDFSQLASMERLPHYLRLRLYMMEACGARPMLAYATGSARSLFKVRTDRQLQYVLEGQVQQDAMLGMLLQEMLDEMLSAPVGSASAASWPHDGEQSTIVVHALSHFLNTSNPKVFPFVPITMRGCGYKKSSGEVVPCVILEFSPDSNQGAFLEHLQRDYTMMGHISAIITLFTLKGDVLHQNAGSIAYYGIQRRSALDAMCDKRRGSGHGGHGGRSTKRLVSPGVLEGSAMASLNPNTPPVLSKLFQFAPPDALEGMLESMVQGGVWRSILPVPITLAASNRPLAVPASGDMLMAGAAPGAAAPGVSPFAAFASPDPDNVFTMDGLALQAPNGDRSIGSRPEAFEGSFALGTTSGSGTRARVASMGHGMMRSIRALNAVPEQSQECERVSFAQHWPQGGAGGGGGGGAERGEAGGQQLHPLHRSAGVPTAASSLAARVGQAGSGPTSPHPRQLSPLPIHSNSGLAAQCDKVPRRSTTFSAAPSISDREALANSGSGIMPPGFPGAGGAAASFTSGAGSSRLARIRRRSGLMLGLDGNLAGALSQSTWGLIGSAGYDGRFDKPSAGRDAGGGDPEPAGDLHASAGRRFECAVQARLAAGRALGLSSGTPAAATTTAAGSGTAAATIAAEAMAAVTAQQPAAACVPSTANGGGIPSPVSPAQPFERVSPSMFPPSLTSAVDQWQQWQYRHSQWQDAMQSQSQQSQQSQSQQTFGLGNAMPSTRPPSTHSQQQPSAAWLLQQQQHGGFSQSSSSAASNSRRGGGGGGIGGGGIGGGGIGGDASGLHNRQSFVDGMPRRPRSVAFGDGSPSPTARSTPTPSAGSLVSPQPSAHQHTDSNLAGCTTFVASMGMAPLVDPSQSRPSPSPLPGQSPGFGQPSRFLAASSPVGSPVLSAAPPGGAGGSAAAAAASTLATAAFQLQSGSPSLERPALPAKDPHDSAVGSRSYGVSADAAGTRLPGGRLQMHSGGVMSSNSVRRAPMRQSERSNPNLVLPRPGGIATSKNVKSATSFSFGSQQGSHHHRPLVRMLSFLNGAPPGGGGAAVAVPWGAQPQPQQQYPQSQQQLAHAHSYTAHSGAHLRHMVRRAASGQFFQMMEPVRRTGSGKAGDNSATGNVGFSSQSCSRFPASTLLCGSLHRRPSMRHVSATLTAPGGGPSGPQGHPVSELDESSSLVGITAMGASREALAAGAGGNGGFGHVGHQSQAGWEREDAPRTYHEVTATPFLDPVSKSQVVMVVQTDVSGRVQLERRLADVMEAEHKLLENIFPRHVLEHIARSAALSQESASQFNLRMLSAMPDLTKTATDHERVTILFADIVGFTSMCKEVPAKAVMKFLNDLYTRFDTLLDIYGVYKVETIGDCYMVAGGLISKDADGFAAVRKDSCDNLQAWRVLSFAKAMLRDAKKVVLPTTQEPVKLRVGIHTGPVVSGVVGTRMPRFCLFGDTINTASRMESTCPYGRIQVSGITHGLVQGEEWEPTGGVEVKGKGIMETYLLKQSPSLALPGTLACASMSTPGLPDSGTQQTHGSNSLSRGAIRAALQSGATAAGSGLGSDSRGIGSAAGAGSLSGNGSTRVASAVTERIPAAATALSSGVPRADGGSGSGARKIGSSSGKNPASFLFNTVW